MAITKDQKTQILQDLIDKFSKSKSVIFSDYRGLNVASVSDLRNKLREQGAETKVAKKTLIKLAAKENNIEDLSDDVMEGPVSATFSYEDEMSGLKVLFKFSKENENLKLLGGIIDGKVVGREEIIALAKLPGREELLAKLIGSMNAPVSGFVGTLSNVLGGFVRVLQAYKDNLPASDEAPADKPAPDEERVELEQGETTAPTGETTAPTGETTAPAGETTAPAGETTAPAGEEPAPAGEEPAPAESDEEAETPTPADEPEAEPEPVADKPETEGESSGQPEAEEGEDESAPTKAEPNEKEEETEASDEEGEEKAA